MKLNDREAESMRIAPGVEMLEISANMMGRVETIYPTLLWDEETALLVDTGYPGQLPLFIEAMERAGVPIAKLDKIIVSHQDLDHIGSLPSIREQCARPIEVFASETEKAYIQGEKSLLKITPESIDKAIEAIPKGVPEEWRSAFRKVLQHPPKSAVNRTVSGGEELPYCDGIIVIDTPGHTPGHISLYHKLSKTLIAADALIVKDGTLQGPDPLHSLDPEEAMRSIKAFTRYDIEAVICYHGGLYNNDANRRIAQLASL
jgi:glyoxylase-like metal-dependent hydrolase (beta-lactamase superfamily II)